MAPLLEVQNLRRDVADRNILANISFTLEPGEILFVRGPSGVGKSLLLRALACLDQTQGGRLLLHGNPPTHVGYPAWRTAVSYVPQSRATSLRGTPAELYFLAQRFQAQRARPRGDLPALIHAFGLEQLVLNQQWGELSGGEAQRVALALSLALGPQVLLLDEPTSACDPQAAMRVEHVLSKCGAALVWVTHDPQQPSRVGGRLLELPLGGVVHLPPPPLQMLMELSGGGGSNGGGSLDGVGRASGGGGGSGDLGADDITGKLLPYSSVRAPSQAGALGGIDGGGRRGGPGPVGPAAAAAALLPAELLGGDGDIVYDGYTEVPSPLPSPPHRLRGRSSGGMR